VSFLRKQESRLVPAQAGTHSPIGFYCLDSHFRGNDNKKGSLARGEAGCFIRLKCYPFGKPIRLRFSEAELLGNQCVPCIWLSLSRGAFSNKYTKNRKCLSGLSSGSMEVSLPKGRYPNQTRFLFTFAFLWSYLVRLTVSTGPNYHNLWCSTRFVASTSGRGRFQ